MVVAFGIGLSRDDKDPSWAIDFVLVRPLENDAIAPYESPVFARAYAILEQLHLELRMVALNFFQVLEAVRVRGVKQFHGVSRVLGLLPSRGRINGVMRRFDHEHRLPRTRNESPHGYAEQHEQIDQHPRFAQFQSPAERPVRRSHGFSENRCSVSHRQTLFF